MVREGRGKTGCKTIVFERLFKERSKCGYNFRRNTSEIIIKDKDLFESFINAVVPYLIQNPETSSRTIDDMGADAFLDLLKPFGFPPNKSSSTSSITGSGAQSNSSTNAQSDGSSTSSKASDTPFNSGSSVTESTSSSSRNDNSETSSTEDTNDSGSGSSRFSVKSKPTLKRKKIPSPLKKLIDECYNLDENNFSNAKTALTRVTLECTLKFVVENTNKPNGKLIKTSNHFDLAFKDRKGKLLTYTNFDILKSKFSELIKDTGIRKAFEDFDIQNPHQIIHNYRVAAVPANAKALCDNLIDLMEFMLQDETDFLNSLDLTKL
ncbi:MAG: hypothetical protein GX102_08660 [Porphyromonadaceae bacterium]|nr:hypothetical protein [Porphyromonadaceae bacterium]